MNLSKKLADEFEPSVRSRGVDYYLRRQVHLDGGSNTQAYAHVKGTRQYQTSLEWEDGTLYAICDCPFFDSDGPCKHLWATILAAESHGHLADAASAPTVEMDFGSVDEDGEDDDDFLVDEDDEIDEVFPQPVIAPPPP